MNRLEKILIVGTLVIGGSLLGLGLYRDNKFQGDYPKSTIMKGIGLMFLAVSSGLGLRGLIEGEDRGYSEELKKKRYSK